LGFSTSFYTDDFEKTFRLTEMFSSKYYPVGVGQQLEKENFHQKATDNHSLKKLKGRNS